MVESVLGAVYVDSRGSLDAVRGVLRALGLMQVLERIVREDVDVLHPVSRLEIWAAKQKPRRELEWVVRKERGGVSCAVLVDGGGLVKAETKYRSRVSQDEVRFRAAEMANAKVSAQSVSIDDAHSQEDVDMQVEAAPDEPVQDMEGEEEEER